MAESKRKPGKKGGRYCVAGTPNGESCTNTQYTPGISTHLFSSEPTVRAQWVKFVRRHRVDFGEPVGKFASLCSAHFEQSCFSNSLASSLPGMEGIKMKRNLISRLYSDKRHCITRGPASSERTPEATRTTAYDKLKSLLTKKMLLNDMKKLSPDAQTSCLEGFHATLNYWHPKLICYSWLGTLCRHILAILHFNENIKRETQLSKDGKECIRVTYPKFKLGEEVVREVACPPTYSYVDAMKALLFTLPKSEMKEVLERCSGKVPKPLNQQFPARRSKEEAVEVYQTRRKMKKTSLFPSEAEQSTLQSNRESNQTSSRSTSRRPYTCSVCKKPLRGHKGQCKK